MSSDLAKMLALRRSRYRWKALETAIPTIPLLTKTNLRLQSYAFANIVAAAGALAPDACLRVAVQRSRFFALAGSRLTRTHNVAAYHLTSRTPPNFWWTGVFCKPAKFLNTNGYWFPRLARGPRASVLDAAACPYTSFRLPKLKDVESGGGRSPSGRFRDLPERNRRDARKRSRQPAK